MRRPQKAFFIVTIFLSIFLSFSIPGLATDYYVKNGGDDLKDGLSDANAWATIAKVNATSFSSGDIIYFNKGDTWREKLIVPSSGSDGSPVTFSSYGTGADPLILRSTAKNNVGDWTDEGGNLWYASSATEVFNCIYDSEASEATMEVNKVDLGVQGEGWWDAGNTRIYVYSVGNPATVYSGSIEIALLDYAIDVNDKAYITIDGLDIRYVGNHGINAVHISTGSNLTVQNCNFKYIGNNYSGNGNTHGRAILLYKYNNSVVSTNTFDHTYTAVKMNSDTTAMVYTVDNNTVTTMHGYGSNTDAIAFGPNVLSDFAGSVIHNNDLSGFIDDGIDLYYASNVIVRNNTVHDIILGDGTGDGNGIKCGGAVVPTGNQILRNHVYNIDQGTLKYGISTNNGTDGVIAYNIIHDVRRGIAVGALGVGGENDSWELYNNVTYDCSEIAIRIAPGIDTDNRTTIAIRNNICEGTTDDIGIGAWVTATGGWNCLINDGSVNLHADSTYSDSASDLYSTDPLFRDAAGGDFHLLMASPCIDKGTDVSLVTDYEGLQIRHAPDIGAYENQTNALFIAKLHKLYLDWLISNIGGN